MAVRASTKRAGSLLLSVLFFVLAFTVYVLFVQPELDAIAELRGARDSKEELLEQQRNVNEQVKSLLSRFKSISNIEEIVSMAIPVEEDFSELLHQLHILSQSSGLVTGGIDFRSLTLPTRVRETNGHIPAMNLGTLQADLLLTGSYSSLKSFMRLLETNVRVLDVTSIRLSKETQIGGNNDFFTYRVTVNAYFQAQNNI